MVKPENIPSEQAALSDEAGEENLELTADELALFLSKDVELKKFEVKLQALDDSALLVLARSAATHIAAQYIIEVLQESEKITTLVRELMRRGNILYRQNNDVSLKFFETARTIREKAKRLFNNWTADFGCVEASDFFRPVTHEDYPLGVKSVVAARSILALNNEPKIVTDGVRIGLAIVYPEDDRMQGVTPKQLQFIEMPKHGYLEEWLTPKKRIAISKRSDELRLFMGRIAGEEGFLRPGKEQGVLVLTSEVGASSFEKGLFPDFFSRIARSVPSLTKISLELDGEGEVDPRRIAKYVERHADIVLAAVRNLDYPGKFKPEMPLPL